MALTTWGSVPWCMATLRKNHPPEWNSHWKTSSSPRASSLYITVAQAQTKLDMFCGLDGRDDGSVCTAATDFIFFLCAKNCQHLFSSWFRFQHVPTQKKVEGPDISALLVSFWCGLFQVVGKVYPMRENHWNQPSRWKRGSWINDSSEFWQLHLTMEVNNCWSQHQRKN